MTIIITSEWAIAHNNFAAVFVCACVCDRCVCGGVCHIIDPMFWQCCVAAPALCGTHVCTFLGDNLTQTTLHSVSVRTGWAEACFRFRLPRSCSAEVCGSRSPPKASGGTRGNPAGSHWTCAERRSGPSVSSGEGPLQRPVLRSVVWPVASLCRTHSSSHSPAQSCVLIACST